PEGALDGEHRDWLERRLAEAPDTPTIVAMHHPPLLTGMPAFDALGLAAEDRAALAGQLRRWPQVRRVVAGHVHCASVAGLGGCVVVTSPSTWRVRPRMRLGGETFELVEGPAGFSLHAVMDGDVVSHVQSIERQSA
ncbi:MAG: phosphodiesterase, partial [Actinomycetota bacterium]|nr:phosphodiesterase [Actinomycetota bacterium]